MVTVTKTAINTLRKLMQKEAEEQKRKCTGLRIYVKGGGCHGYQYGMAFEFEPAAEDDIVIEKDSITIIIDSQSAPLLQGAEVDYTDSLQGSGFAIKNLNAKTTCGCGSSFSG